MKKFAQFLRNENGATILEYGLLAALVTGGAVLLLPAISTRINTGLTNLGG